METEKEESICPFCGEKVVSYWTERGCIRSPEYVLVADLIFHTPCWDKQVEAFPP